MSIAVLISEVNDAARLIPWAVEIARLRETSLLIVIPQREKRRKYWRDLDDDESAGPIARAVFDTAKESGICLDANRADEITAKALTVSDTVVDQQIVKRVDEAEPVERAQLTRTTSTENRAADGTNDPTEPQAQIESEVRADSEAPNAVQDQASFVPDLEVRQFCDPNPGWSLVDEINNISVSLLIIPAPAPSRTGDSDSWQTDLFRNAPCDVMYLRDDDRQNLSETKVMVVANGDIDDQTALQLGWDFAQQSGGTLTAALIEPNIDVVAPLVGRKVLEKIVRGGLHRREQDQVIRKVVVADKLQKGIEQLKPEEYDLILVGTRSRRDVRSILMSSMGATTRANGNDLGIPAVAIIRRGISFQNRLLLLVRRVIERFVPQLDREQRVSLVERIQSSSKWNFDFVSLIFLSTLIAAVGLIQNSIAVVIGAMLVAPLMTPIVGVGLGLAQSNIRLIQTATKTVFYGFTTALIVGFALGIIFCGEITSEMTARENPGFTDLLIALASGIAAAYAMGRPNLLSALPGVAIAAALVPPVATAGIAMSQAQWHLAAGAILLFSTNIVAIVLGTAATFWLIGLTRNKKDEQSHPSWPRWIFLCLVVLTIILTTLMTINADQKTAGFAPSARQTFHLI